MKWLASFAVFASMFAFGETVINYDDGSTYTLGENEQIYISTPHSALFKRKLFKDKSTYFIAQKPWSARDYVASPEDEFAIGSHEWCKAYIPWNEGYTFNMQTWQRACDTNGDGEYDENDAGWDE
jgi:hypothetical protein